MFPVGSVSTTGQNGVYAVLYVLFFSSLLHLALRGGATEDD